VIVLRAPGTNCDLETAYAFEHCGARAERVHLFRVLERPKLLGAFQILCVPGGFSYGDDVGARAIFAGRLRPRPSAAPPPFPPACPARSAGSCWPTSSPSASVTGFRSSCAPGFFRAEPRTGPRATAKNPRPL